EKEGTPGEIVIDEQSWFFAPGNKFTKSLSPYRGAVAEAVKFTRYGSAIIPSRCGTIMWSVDRLNRRDFFRYDPADCLSMPGREQVPDYTVVRFVNGEIDLERMAQLLEHCSPGKGHVLGTQKCTEEIAALAHVFAGSNARGWEQIDSLLQRLRQEFRHDSGERDNRESGTSHESSPAALGQSAHGQSALERFLQQREGPSYLFATTAALMLEHLGYETRLVTGFYVSREHYIARDQNYAVLPQDAHVWLEVNAGHGYWIPLEPTPGYRPPRYAASAWYRIRQAGPQLAIAVGVLALAALLVSWCKSLLFDAACWLVAPLLTLADDRRRVRWTAWVLDQRLSLLGDRRPNGIVLREHLKTSLHLPEHWNSQLRNLLDACDGLIFGKNHGLSVEQRASMHAVWKQLSTRQMRSLRVRENG
ncbi:MAG: transglutaminase domain-containing protein, partial [Planctomycetales bacterium]|nr:transglutaminase domain-containing protein [Planctomycetales bacterium]